MLELKTAIPDEVIDQIAEKLFEKVREALPAKVEPIEVMNVEELSSYLHVKPSWVYKQVQLKTVPHFHMGKYPRFRKKDIDTWILEHSTPSTRPPYPSLPSKRSK